ncbi:hypothetical protein J2W83_003251 [Pseudomonas hunanensis]|uniref:Uncharacterized protein n=1 Tax=Pseudomonas hunanensis TaxID=1247546 RepID=A0ACC6K5D7_9PSED|nr:hypothetical protein [Pseudomonas hunanensis]
MGYGFFKKKAQQVVAWALYCRRNSAKEFRPWRWKLGSFAGNCAGRTILVPIQKTALGLQFFCCLGGGLELAAHDV